MIETRTAEYWASIAAQRAEKAANHALDAHAALGQVMREIADLRREVREGFAKFHVTRKELASLSDEFEDTKIRNLRKELRVHKSRWRWIVGVLGAIIAGLTIALIAHLLHWR